MSCSLSPVPAAVGRGKDSDTNPHAAHSSLQERAELEAISYSAGEEFQPALAFSLDQDGTVSLSVSCGYLGFRGSQGKHSAGKTEPPSLEGFALPTEIR